MHELSLAEGTLEVALRHARRAGAGRIAALNLVVGEFTPLEETSLAFYLDRLARGTEADGARLNVRRVPASLTCLECGSDIDPQALGGPCPACGGARLRLATGDECYLESMDIEEQTA